MDGVLFMGGILVVALIFLAIGKWYPGSGADVVDWKPTRSYEDEMRLELEDVDQMLEAQNERRRRTGRRELTEEEIREQVAAEEEERKRAHERAEAGRAAEPPGADL